MQNPFSKRSLSLALSIAVIVLAATSALGWLLGIGRLAQPIGGFAPMQLNSAIGFLLGGLGLMRCNSQQYRAAAAFGIATALWGAGNAAQSAFGWNLGLEELSFAGLQSDTLLPRRLPALNTSLGLVLVGLSLFLQAYRKSSYALVASYWLNAVVLFVAFSTVVAFLLKTDDEHIWPFLSEVSSPTAGCFFLFGIAFFVVPEGIPSNSRHRRRIVAGAIAIGTLSLTVLVANALQAIETNARNVDDETATLALSRMLDESVSAQLIDDRRAAESWVSLFDAGTPAQLDQLLSRSSERRFFAVRDFRANQLVIEPARLTASALPVEFLDNGQASASPRFVTPEGLFVVVRPLPAMDSDRGFYVSAYDMGSLAERFCSRECRYTLTHDGRTIWTRGMNLDQFDSPTARIEIAGIDFDVRACVDHENAFWLKTRLLVVAICLALATLGPLAYLSAERSSEVAAENQRLASEAIVREQRLERALRGSTAGIFDYDLKANEIYWSTQLKTMLGLDESYQPTIEGFRERIHPDDIARFDAALDEHLASGQPFEHEYRLKRERGGYIWIRSRGQAIRNENDEPVRMAGSVTDISEWKSAEGRIHENERLFRAMIESLNLGVLLVAEDGSIRRFNAAAVSMFGYDEDAFAKLSIGELVPESKRRQHADLRNAYHRSPHQKYDIEHRQGLTAQRKDGSIFAVEIGLTPLTLEGERLVLAVVADVSVRENAKRALQMSNERFKLAVEGASVGIWDWFDVNQENEWWSPRVYELLGYADGEIAPSIATFRKLLHPDDVEPTMAKIKECFEGDGTFNTDYRLRAKSGAYLWFMVRGVLQRDENGAPKRMVGSIQDINDRRASEEVRVQNAALLRSNRDLAEFTYVASHDLQEPLRTIINFLDLLQDRYGSELPDEAKEFIRFTTDGAARMRGMIGGLLSLSRVDSHAVEPTDVDLNELVVQTYNSLRALVDERGVTLQHDHLPTIQGYPVLLQQLFQNLIENAIKYVPEGRAPDLRIGFTEDDASVTIAFCDNGIGIAPQHREFIFGMFKRLHGRKQFKGNGIGLSLCRKIVEKHMGKIWVEDSSEEGSEFRVLLSKRLSPVAVLAASFAKK